MQVQVLQVQVLQVQVLQVQVPQVQVLQVHVPKVRLSQSTKYKLRTFKPYLPSEGSATMSREYKSRASGAEVFPYTRHSTCNLFTMSSHFLGKTACATDLVRRYLARSLGMKSARAGAVSCSSESSFSSTHHTFSVSTSEL